MRQPKIDILVNFDKTKIYEGTFFRKLFGLIPHGTYVSYANRKCKNKIELYLEAHSKKFNEFIKEFSDTISHELIHFNIDDEGIDVPVKIEHKITKQMGLNLG